MLGQLLMEPRVSLCAPPYRKLHQWRSARSGKTPDGREFYNELHCLLDAVMLKERNFSAASWEEILMAPQPEPRSGRSRGSSLGEPGIGLLPEVQPVG